MQPLLLWWNELPGADRTGLGSMSVLDPVIDVTANVLLSLSTANCGGGEVHEASAAI